jgi:hypothetical protein
MSNAAPALSLKNLLVPSKTVEIDYPGLNGFKVNVVFLSRETLVGIRKKATKTTYKNRQPVEELDDKLFLQLYTNACIKGWKGLKLSYLEQLAPVDLSGQDSESELQWDQDNALFLMQSSANFDAFISETVTELSNFTKTSTAK